MKTTLFSLLLLFSSTLFSQFQSVIPYAGYRLQGMTSSPESYNSDESHFMFGTGGDVGILFRHPLYSWLDLEYGGSFSYIDMTGNDYSMTAVHLNIPLLVRASFKLGYGSMGLKTGLVISPLLGGTVYEQMLQGRTILDLGFGNQSDDFIRRTNTSFLIGYNITTRRFEYGVNARFGLRNLTPKAYKGDYDTQSGAFTVYVGVRIDNRRERPSLFQRRQ